MDEPRGSVKESADSGIDRRRLLKGAAAAGIGVAAWSAPSITSIGGTPVYAAACTGGKQTTKIGGRNTSCPCGNNNTGKFTSYFAPETSACAGSPVSFVVFSNGPNCVPVTNSFVCPAGTQGNDNAGFCIKPLEGQFALVTAFIYQGNCGTSTVVGTGNPLLLAKVSTGIVQGEKDINGNLISKFTALPKQPCGSFFDSSNIFIRYTVTTADDDACLP